VFVILLGLLLGVCKIPGMNNSKLSYQLLGGTKKMQRAIFLRNLISGPIWLKMAVNLHRLIRLTNLFITAYVYEIGKCYNVTKLMKMLYFGMLNIFSRVQSACRIIH
jgi:hypothetical protein